ncbi:MAG TPA: efflux RND transporter periplasmic adaptor subunit [Gammaproteobacteria bacterium]|jgi:membrane fusion protein (multidrug efflux system)|nr:efflux RND transporter periplasmic adaptor subunit [Gammaproteobacteria bacterium]
MAENSNQNPPINPAVDPAAQRRLVLRKRGFVALGSVFAAAALGYGAYWFAVGSRHQTTDDAYVAGNRVPVMAEAEGTVTSILADETNEVTQGQVLVRMDDADARVALQETEAKLASTVRHVEELYANDRQLAAKAAAQQATLSQHRSDYQRHQALNKRGYFSDSALEQSGTQVQVDQHELAEDQQAITALHAELGTGSVADNPDVKLAAAEVRAAYLALQRMIVVAPVSGYVAKRDVQIGQRVGASAPLMAIVPLSQIWVDANFKESQLSRIRPGQDVELHSDVYGSRVSFHGTVAGVDAGTGSAFALLPAQNATGNWIKVVQRVPVRVQIADADLKRFPLRIGLSMEVSVDTHAGTDGPALAPVPVPQYSTPVYDQRMAGVETLIAGIISANGGDTKPLLAKVTTAAVGRDR